jgi:hypothetical protein
MGTVHHLVAYTDLLEALCLRDTLGRRPITYVMKGVVELSEATCG